MISKIKLQETINMFPEEFTIDELMEKIIFLDKIEKGNKQSEIGDTITENELDSEIKKWFK